MVRAESVISRRMDNILHVEDQILKLTWEQGFWRRRWIYVTEVFTAAPCVVLVSDTSAGSASVAVKATGPEALGGPSGKLALKLSGSSGMSQTFLSSDRAPFMWRGRCQSKWTGEFGDRGEDSEDIYPDKFIGKFDPAWLDEDST
jgi:hypothetical protein